MRPTKSQEGTNVNSLQYPLLYPLVTVAKRKMLTEQG